MWQNHHPHKSSSSASSSCLRDSIVALEADIQHANTLFGSILLTFLVQLGAVIFISLLLLLLHLLQSPLTNPTSYDPLPLQLLLNDQASPRFCQRKVSLQNLKTMKVNPPSKSASFWICYWGYSFLRCQSCLWFEDGVIDHNAIFVFRDGERMGMLTWIKGLFGLDSTAASLPGGYGGDHIHMKLSYSSLAPLFFRLIQWLDFTCTDALPTYLGLFQILIYKVYGDGMPSLSSKERRASLKDFYGVIYPSLRQLEGEFKDENRNNCRQVASRKSPKKGFENKEEAELRDDEECGICMEMNMIMILPSCGHSLCITCFHDWKVRSESCPFCRGSLKRVSSTDLWVVIDDTEVVDRLILAKDNLRRFYLYIHSLPLLTHPDPHVFIFNYML